MAEPQATRWGVDTSIILGALRHGNGDCQQLLQRIDKEPSIRAVASVLLIAEAYLIQETAADAALTTLLDSTTFEWVQTTIEIARTARDLGRKHQGLRGADAVHLASAIVAGCDAFFATDKHFNALYGLTVDGTLVERPGKMPGQQTLNV